MKRLINPGLCVALCAVALASPQGASAQVTDQIRHWSLPCGAGTLGCISWSLRLQYDPGAFAHFGGTQATATVTNRQGLDGFEGAPYDVGYVPLSLRNLAWDNEIDPTYDHFGGSTVTSDGNAGWVQGADPGTLIPRNNQHSAWDVLVLPQHLYPHLASGPGAAMWLEQNVDDGWDLYGCDGPGDPWHLSWGWYSTCGGSLTFNWRVPGKIAFTDDTYSTDGAVLVPEPSTYLLMLTGLFGLGFVAWRRKDVMLA